MFNFLGSFTRSEYNGFKAFVDNQIADNDAQKNYLLSKANRMDKLRTRLRNRAAAINIKLKQEYDFGDSLLLPINLSRVAPPTGDENNPMAEGMFLDDNTAILMWEVKQIVVPQIKGMYENLEYSLKRSYLAIDNVERRLTLRNGFQAKRDEVFGYIDGYWGQPQYGNILKDDIQAE